MSSDESDNGSYYTSDNESVDTTSTTEGLSEDGTELVLENQGSDAIAHQFASLENLQNLENLEILDLIGNNLAVFPVNISTLTNLKELYLSDNNFTDLPESIGDLVNLERLVIDRNNENAENA